MVPTARPEHHPVLIALLVACGAGYVWLAEYYASSFATCLWLLAWSLIGAILLRRAARASHLDALRRMGNWLAPATLLLIGLCVATMFGRLPLAGTLILTFMVAMPPAVSFAAALAVYRAPSANRAQMPILRTAGVFLLAASLVAAAPTWYTVSLEMWNEPNSASMRSHVGCYRLDLGRWTPAHQLGHGVAYMVPPLIQLDTMKGRDVKYGDPNDVYSRKREADRLLIRPGWKGSTAFWQPIDDSYARVIWSSGYNGVTMKLRRAGGGYRGRAYAFTDVMGSLDRPPQTSVTASPVDCRFIPFDSARLAVPETDTGVVAEEGRGR